MTVVLVVLIVLAGILVYGLGMLYSETSHLNHLIDDMIESDKQFRRALYQRGEHVEGPEVATFDN
jgi:hypothetical protein